MFFAYILIGKLTWWYSKFYFHNIRYLIDSTSLLERKRTKKKKKEACSWTSTNVLYFKQCPIRTMSYMLSVLQFIPLIFKCDLFIADNQWRGQEFLNEWVQLRLDSVRVWTSAWISVPICKSVWFHSNSILYRTIESFLSFHFYLQIISIYPYLSFYFNSFIFLLIKQHKNCWLLEKGSF